MGSTRDRAIERRSFALRSDQGARTGADAIQARRAARSRDGVALRSGGADRSRTTIRRAIGRCRTNEPRCVRDNRRRHWADDNMSMPSSAGMRGRRRARRKADQKGDHNKRQSQFNLPCSASLGGSRATRARAPLRECLDPLAASSVGLKSRLRRDGALRHHRVCWRRSMLSKAAAGPRRTMAAVPLRWSGLRQPSAGSSMPDAQFADCRCGPFSSNSAFSGRSLV